MWGGVGRCGEMWGGVRRRGEMWGGVGRCGEIWGGAPTVGEEDEPVVLELRLLRRLLLGGLRELLLEQPGQM